MNNKSYFGNKLILLRSQSLKNIQFSFVKFATAEDVECNNISPSSKSEPLTSSPNWFDQSWEKQESNKPSQKVEEKKPEVSQAKLTTNCQNSYVKSTPTAPVTTETYTNNTSGAYYGGNFVNNPSFYPSNPTVTEYQPADMYVNYNAANVYSGNYYSPLQYPTNNLYCGSYSAANLQPNSYTYSPVSYTNQLSSNTRNFIQQKQNAVPYNTGQQWIMHQYRTPSVYNVNHIPPQPCFLLPPQLPKQQRWMPAGHYVRPATPQTFHVNATPPHTPPSSWNTQGQVYRTSSTQHVCPQNQVSRSHRISFTHGALLKGFFHHSEQLI